MLIAALVLLALASVPLTGGRLSALAEVQVRGGGIAVLALAVQVLIVTIFPGGDHGLHTALHLATYALLGAFVWVNRRIPGLLVIGAGGALNLVAIAANGGVMPASAAALRRAGLNPDPGQFTNSGALAHPHLLPLGDVFATPAGMPLHNVFSVGDVLIVLGVLFLAHRLGRAGRLALTCHAGGAHSLLVRAAGVRGSDRVRLVIADGSDVHRFGPLPPWPSGLRAGPGLPGFAVPRKLVDAPRARWSLQVGDRALDVARPR
jgi:Family of unknown function (DUF5317)